MAAKRVWVVLGQRGEARRNSWKRPLPLNLPWNEIIAAFDTKEQAEEYIANYKYGEHWWDWAGMSLLLLQWTVARVLIEKIWQTALVGSLLLVFSGLFLGLLVGVVVIASLVAVKLHGGPFHGPWPGVIIVSIVLSLLIMLRVKAGRH